MVTFTVELAGLSLSTTIVPSNPRKLPRTVENIMCLTEKPTCECDASIAYVVVPVLVLVAVIGKTHPSHLIRCL